MPFVPKNKRSASGVKSQEVNNNKNFCLIYKTIRKNRENADKNPNFILTRERKRWYHLENNPQNIKNCGVISKEVILK